MKNNLSVKEKTKLSLEKLRSTVDFTQFEFETTEEVPILSNVIGQARGTKVMKFGLNVNKIGYNLYVAGISGTGKTSFTETIVKEFAEKETTLYDWCYVYNFENGSKPKVLQLPVGMGESLKEDMKQLIENLKVDIPRAFNEEGYQKEKAAIIRDMKEQSSKVMEALNDVAKEHGFVIRQSGSGILTVPVIDGEPITEEQYRKLDDDQLKEINQKSTLIQEKMVNYQNQLRQLEKEAKKTLENVEQKVALAAIGFHMYDLINKYSDCQEVVIYLKTVQNDILKNISEFLPNDDKQEQNPLSMMMPKRPKESIYTKYHVNLFIDNRETEGAPVVIADNPNFYNLIGKVEYENRMGVMTTNFTKVKPGYLHRANGGYIIIQAKDIFSLPHAWEGLKRALLNRKLTIENIAEQSGMMATTSISPDPIPLDTKVIIIGNLDIYQILYQHEEDFRKLFKVKADFDVEMNANLENMTRLASFIHTHCDKYELLHFDRTAVAKIVEYSKRLAGHQDKLSTRFNEQIDIIYEADTWAKMDDSKMVSAEHIMKAILEKEYRNNLYEEKLQESIEDGSILIDTEGGQVGQVNGLAVYNLGQYSFGKPSRITATTFVGKDGIINIERESKMSGNIHNKGVYILGGYLGQQFAQEHPLSLTAHIAFEQSYGGVDGDSASSTELYAILSSLADVPIDQGIAVTGSVNQKGEIQPIGGANEKIEGFYKVCKERGLTGGQGVLIPHQNVQNLMLRDEVVQAVENGEFHVYAIKTIEEGIEILTGLKAGSKGEYGNYPDGSVYGKVTHTLKLMSEKHYLAQKKHN